MEQLIVLAGKPRCRSLHYPFLARVAPVVEFDLDILSRDNLPPAAGVAVIDCGTDTNEGLRLVTEVKAARIDLPVILVSPTATDEVVAAAFRRGAREFFEHPVAEEQLRNFVEFMLEVKKKKGAQREPRAVPPDRAHVESPAKVPDIKRCHKHPAQMPALSEFLKRLRFCPKFRQQVGMTPLQYMNMVRTSREAASGKTGR